MNIDEFTDFMSRCKEYDLTQILSIHTPPWPSYVPLQVQYFKRIAGAHMGMGANGQIIKSSNHVGTHMDGEIHFYGAGKIVWDDLKKWNGPGVIVDISKECGDYDLYSPELLESKVEIKEGDILLIKTGFYEKYGWDRKGSDELRYFVNHPGPDPSFHTWAKKKKIKWIGVDCGSADHPMNTIIRDWHPKHFIEAEQKIKDKYGKSWDELFPPKTYYQVMHIDLFPKGIVHAENLKIIEPELSNKRVWVNCYPINAKELESVWCRIVALLPPD